MSFLDVDITTEYRSGKNEVVKDFYIPLLSEAIMYKRAVGFFSSSSLIQISYGISKMIENGGRIQLIVSPRLSDEDIVAMKLGYEKRIEIIEKALIREWNEPENIYEEERLNIMANLIANNKLDIKVAFTEDAGGIGIYHEKMGLIYDAEENIIAFSGSTNETGMAFTANYEVIDVYCSWKTAFEQNKVEEKELAFNKLWNDEDDAVKIISFPKVAISKLLSYKKSIIAYEIDENELEGKEKMVSEEERRYTDLFGNKHEKKIFKMPDGLKLHEYQIDAINEWERKTYCGIFDMATGTGKTLTGLAATVRLYEHLAGKICVFIVCPYQHLVEQWVEDIVGFGIEPIIGYSSSAQKNWKRLLESAVLDYKLKVRNRDFFCFVSTNATFASDYVQSQIQKIKGKALLIVDEAHNFGAEYLSKTLTDKFQYRLALSATISRHNDEEGTKKLFGYFGDKCIEYTIDRAIRERKLTRYKYYPIITILNDLELEKYSILTYEIGKCIIKGKNGKTMLSEKGKILAMERARLVAGAEDKLTKLKEYIYPYIKDKHILVYCGAAKLLNENQEHTSTDIEDLRQIDVVTDLLGNQLNMKVSQFTSKEDSKERELLKREFAKGETIQALIAIKCLDEGVNIPKIKLAFILASTTNPKEYIQRRGRVLRIAEEKSHAVIYDFITLPRQLDEVHSLTAIQMNEELSLVKNELFRAQEFARLAMNMAEAESIINNIKDAYGIEDSFVKYEEGI